MPKGKSSEKTQTVQLPKEIEDQAKENLVLAKALASLQYAPNFGITTAAFTPQQEAAFQGTQNAASAFGMPVAQGTGMPKAETVNGISGYSTKPYYEHSLAQMDPKVREQYENFLQNPFGYASNMNSARAGGGASGVGGSGSGKNSGNGILGSALNNSYNYANRR